MRKRKILAPLLFFLSFYVGHAQLIMIDGETGEYRYEEVVQSPGLSSSEISLRASSWLREYYSDDIFDSLDSTSTKQLTAYSFTWTFIRKKIDAIIFFDVSIQTKEGRYKYDFSNFREGKLVRGDFQGIPLKTYIERFPEKYRILIEEPIDAEMVSAIESLKFFIENKKLPPTEEDW